MSTGRRRHVHMEDELWDRAAQGAARETIATGEQVTRADFIRRAVESRCEDSKTWGEDGHDAEEAGGTG